MLIIILKMTFLINPTCCTQEREKKNLSEWTTGCLASFDLFKINYSWGDDVTLRIRVVNICTIS
jgi:hypothetical protein